MSKAKSEQQLPEFVVDGQFEDAEWREAAATPEAGRSKGQKRTYQAGPRLHPYGPNAYRDEAPDGTARWFPDRDARERYVNQNEPTEQKAQAPAREGGQEEQVKATRKGLESAETVRKGAR